jgi:hypothetical protein
MRWAEEASRYRTLCEIVSTDPKISRSTADLLRTFFALFREEDEAQTIR